MDSFMMESLSSSSEEDENMYDDDDSDETDNENAGGIQGSLGGAGVNSKKRPRTGIKGKKERGNLNVMDSSSSSSDDEEDENENVSDDDEADGEHAEEIQGFRGGAGVNSKRRPRTGIKVKKEKGNLTESSSKEDENMSDDDEADNENQNPEEIQGFPGGGAVSKKRPRTGIKVMRENGKYLCHICGHPFKQMQDAIKHRFTHMNELELQGANVFHQRCPHSPQKIFFDRQHYALHINSHEGIKNFKCPICQKGFTHKTSMKRHVLTHANAGVQTPLPFRHVQCYFCHKKVVNMSFLLRHLVVHTKETPFKCSYCNKWFTREAGRNSHIRHVHPHPDNPSRFPCPQCPKAFNEKGRLTWHVKLAHGEKNHHCSTCSKSFTTKRVLDGHVVAVHNKIRHGCPHCRKTYTAKNSLMNHIKQKHNNH